MAKRDPEWVLSSAWKADSFGVEAKRIASG